MTLGVSDTITIPKDTYGIYINFTIYNNDSTAHNLTGMTITFKVWKPGVSGTLIVSGACSIVVAASGTCRYLVVDGDFDTVGRYKYELELTKASYKDNTEPALLTVTESG